MAFLQATLFNAPRTGFNVMAASDAVGMGLNLNIRCACLCFLPAFCTARVLFKAQIYILA